MNKKILFLFFLISCLGYSVFAKDLPQRPSPPRLVNDFAAILDASEAAALEQKLVRYFDTTSTQIAIVIESSLDGEDVFDYSQKLAQSWGIGEKGKSNGVLIYVAFQDHKLWIQTGYGLEGALPDITCKQIVDNELRPAFRQKEYYRGLDEATNSIIAAAAGEYHNDRAKKTPGMSTLILVLLILFLLFAFGRRRGGGGGRGLWMGPAYFGTFGSGGFSSGGGGWGGSSGGGSFGGFGGGSFGGGGAGGSW